MANPTGFNLPEAVALITRTPATLKALLSGLPGIWVHGNEGKDTWNAADIVAHLISGERNDWIPRVRTLLEHGEGAPSIPSTALRNRKSFRASRWNSFSMNLPGCEKKTSRPSRR